MESEKVIEKKLTLEVKKLGGLALKFSSSFFTGIPDRIVLMPKGKIYFVELKSEGKKPTPRQVIVIEQLRNLGFKVFVVDTSIKLKMFLDEIQTA